MRHCVDGDDNVGNVDRHDFGNDGGNDDDHPDANDGDCVLVMMLTLTLISRWR